VPGGNSIEEIKERTKVSNPVMDRGSSELKQLVGKMMDKQFLKRPTVNQILQDPWFKSTDSMQVLNDKELKALVHRSERSEVYRALLADVAARQNMAQLKELNDIFIRLDVNNDGRISAEELRQGLAAARWNSRDIEKLVDVLGITGDAEASYDEFLGEMLAAREPEENKMLLKVFNEADVSGNGFITGSELEALAQRPAIVQILGSPEIALQKLDPCGKRQLTWQEFRDAVQGTAACGPQRKESSSKYQVGQKVQYLSRSMGSWIDTEVLRVDEASGAVELQCKPGAWQAGENLAKLVRPQGGQQQVHASFRRGYYVGQTVELYSMTHTQWMECKVTDVDARTGALQVDKKPGYWFQGRELASRIRLCTGADASQGARAAMPAADTGRRTQDLSHGVQRGHGGYGGQGQAGHGGQAGYGGQVARGVQGVHAGQVGHGGQAGYGAQAGYGGQGGHGGGHGGQPGYGGHGHVRR